MAVRFCLRVFLYYFNIINIYIHNTHPFAKTSTREVPSKAANRTAHFNMVHAQFCWNLE